MNRLNKSVTTVIIGQLILVLICCSITVGVANYLNWEESLLRAEMNWPANLMESEVLAPLLGNVSTVLFWTSLLAVPFRLVFVLILYLLALVIHRLAWPIAGAMLHSRFWKRVFSWSSYRFKTGRFSIKIPTPHMRQERQKTIQQLIASVISITAFSTATMLSLAQFLNAGSLAVVTGLFTAAFGFGARTLIGDLLAGISHIFEDNFDVGEKIEIAHVTGKVEGAVENVNLRTMSVRAPTGELYIIPNGEIRVLRNFSRGRFSTADVKCKIAASDLKNALAVLQESGRDAVSVLPNLLEPWQIISEEGTIGEHVELTLLVKARFGKAATLRTNLLAFVQQKLQENGINLVD